MLQNLLLLTLVGSCLAPSLALAECGKGTQTVFSCTTAKGKVIEVCDAGKTIDYSFGKPDSKPEIVVKAPRQAASTTQWQGIGRTMSYSVEVPNGNTRYSVFWSVDKMMEGDTQEPAIEAGVAVEINQKPVATVRCDNKKPIVQEIEGIDLKATE